MSLEPSGYLLNATLVSLFAGCQWYVNYFEMAELNQIHQKGHVTDRSLCLHCVSNKIFKPKLILSLCVAQHAKPTNTMRYILSHCGLSRLR